MNKNVRYLALLLLLKIKNDELYSNIGLNDFLNSYDLSDKDRKLFTILVYGVLQHHITLDYLLKPFINPKSKLDIWVYELLILAIYQMKYLDKIPNHAIFNETINIAKFKGNDGIRRFVTGVLHAVDRRGLKVNYSNLPYYKKLSIKYSIPEWLVSLFDNNYGRVKLLNILSSINKNPLKSIRVNLNKVSKENLRLNLENEGIFTRDSLMCNDGLIVLSGNPFNTKSFRNGEFIFQDESAMLVADSMRIKPGELILDSCAAPGGKSTQIAEYLNHDGKVISLDIYEKKLHLIDQNAKKLGLEGMISTKLLDARNVSSIFKKNSFDKILVDAPCSGIGLIRRKPEIRYKKNLSDSLNLSHIQLSILEDVSSCLKSGGLLTYSTCTILNIENQNVIDLFLNKHPEFRQIKTYTSKNIKHNRKELGLTIYPDDYYSDGFFIATLIKR